MPQKPLDYEQVMNMLRAQRFQGPPFPEGGASQDIEPMSPDSSDPLNSQRLASQYLSSKMSGPPGSRPWDSGDAASYFDANMSVGAPPAQGGSSQGPTPWGPADAANYFPGNQSFNPSGGLSAAMTQGPRQPISFERDRSYGTKTPAGTVVQTGDNSYEIVDEPRQPVDIVRGERKYGEKTPWGSVVKTGDNSYEIADNVDDSVADSSDQSGTSWKDISGPVKVVGKSADKWKDISGPVKVVGKSADKWKDVSGPVSIVERGDTPSIAVKKPAAEVRARVAPLVKKIPAAKLPSIVEAQLGELVARNNKTAGPDADGASAQLDKLSGGVKAMRNDVTGSPLAPAMSPAAASLVSAAQGASQGDSAPKTVDDLEALVNALKVERKRGGRGSVAPAPKKVERGEDGKKTSFIAPNSTGTSA